MVNLGGMGIRTLLLLVLATVVLAFDVNMAYAQSSACSRLDRQLRQFDRNGDFQQRDGNSQAARQLARDVQNAESRYIRDGCNDAAKAGQTLSPQCQQVAREVLRLRRDYAAVSQSVNSAGAVSQQREAILQEMARFGCNADGGSNATFSNERQNVFDRIFGTTTEGDFSNGEVVSGGGYNTGYRTVRTVCVRLSDGYFWPISYSTLPDYVGNDMGQCKAMCPNEQVEIYYYDNPGQEPEQMRNMFNQAYTDLPTAFKYRNAIDMNASCRVTPQSDGKLITATAEDGQTRAMIEVQGASFPLPLRDPRGQVPVPAVVEAVQTASLVDVPLPRPRPAGPGETVARVVAPPPGESQLRLVQFGDKVVRVVGPDTPYAQPTGAGS